MTLKELCKDVVLDAEVIDVCVWNDDRNDYDDVFGFCDCDDLGDILVHFNEAKYSHYFKPGDEKYLDYEVRCIESYKDCEKAILRIEIEKGEE